MFHQLCNDFHTAPQHALRFRASRASTSSVSSCASEPRPGGRSRPCCRGSCYHQKSNKYIDDAVCLQGFLDLSASEVSIRFLLLYLHLQGEDELHGPPPLHGSGGRHPAGSGDIDHGAGGVWRGGHPRTGGPQFHLDPALQLLHGLLCEPDQLPGHQAHQPTHSSGDSLLLPLPALLCSADCNPACCFK